MYIQGNKGDCLIILDAKILHELTSVLGLISENKDIYINTLIWNRLKSQKENTLYLTKEEVEESDGKGYIKENGIWTPQNKTVAKIWDFLNRGKDLKEYLETIETVIYNRHPRKIIQYSVLNIIYKPFVSQKERARLRNWKITPIDAATTSDIGNHNPLAYTQTVIGVSNELQENKNTLESSIQMALETGQPFEYNGQVYAPVKGVKLK